MCGFVADCFDMSKLSREERAALKESLERRKQELQARLDHINQALEKVK